MNTRDKRTKTSFPIAPAKNARRQATSLPVGEKSRYRSCMALPRRNDELDEFKSQINICEYMSSRGFTLDRKQSSRRSAVMRHPNGDKLIVSRNTNRHWVYWNVHDDCDKGTIIDFVKLRDRYSLGEIRKELRPWIGKSGEIISVPRRQFAELVSCEFDVTRVHIAWKKTSPINGLHDYLERVREIPRRVLSDPIFKGRIHTDYRRNAVFPHYNSDGFCGFEIKNEGFTGFSPGGTKGLWCSRPRSDDQELVVCETSIDALSFATLYGTKRKRFVSTAGKISSAQKVILQAAARKMASGSTIVLAMDNDPAGQQLASAITKTLQEMGLTDKTIVTQLPRKNGEDWNDVLRRSGSCKLAFPTLG